MKLKRILSKLNGAYNGAIQGFKFGGYVKAVISEINYGNLFSEDDVILVSGGSKGIGLAVAEKILKEGATVIITGRNLKKLQDVSSDYSNSRLFVAEMDISNADLLEDKISEIENMIGKPITALINNAGVYSETHFPIWEKVCARITLL